MSLFLYRILHVVTEYVHDVKVGYTYSNYCYKIIIKVVVFLEIKLICRKENYDKYKDMLEKSGFTVTHNASLTFKEDDYVQETFVGLYQNNYEIIHYKDIIYIESYGHEITLYTLQKEYIIKEKLYEVENILNDKGFIRVNKSTVVNKYDITRIEPSFNSKLTLIMNNHKKITVTRNYNSAFKQFIGL